MENKLKEVASVFFRLGWIAFGGPAAHIAMMEKEVVEKRKWISRQHFLDLMGATNLIPGPNSTEMTMHCGHERAGWKGLFVAGICFIFPAVLLTGILAHFYVTYGEVPAIEPLFFGIKPAVLSIIMLAIIKLGKKALKNWQIGVIGAIAIALSIFGISEVLCILIAGIIAIIWFGISSGFTNKNLSSFLPLGILLAGKSIVKISTAKIFLVFLKVGAVLFGSGYVLVAYLNDELVDKLGWLTRSELLDAIAMGQFTPGPVLSTATFVGYQMGGVNGALAATLGMFLPSFLFVWLLNPIVPKLRKSKIASSFLDGVNIGAVAIMVVVLFVMTKDVLLPGNSLDWKALVIALIGIIITLKFKKVSSVWIVLGGMVLGYLLYSFL